MGTRKVEKIAALVIAVAVVCLSFSPDINEVLGRNQSQIVVFSPEKLEIVDRTLKERICDLKDKFSAIIAQLKYQRTHMI